MSAFVFEECKYDERLATATFRYRFEDGLDFAEQIVFERTSGHYDRPAFERALFLAFVLIGVSYYKTFPTSEVRFAAHEIDQWQADFLNKVYQEGLSQFAFENNLSRQDLARFTSNGAPLLAIPYKGDGVLSLQSGGKDSLLVAARLRRAEQKFESFYISSTGEYPKVIDDIGAPVMVVRRLLDHQQLRVALEQGALNGHVPVTYIVLSISLMQAILVGKNTIFAAIGHEGEEPHGWIDDLPINHQWSKTWQAEQLFAEYVSRYVSGDIRAGSPLRQYSELSIVRQFVELAWRDFSTSFSSCNVANYKQGANNNQLSWCGHCPKCANSYLLFAPFVDSFELQSVFAGDLFAHTDLEEIFKGLLGIDGVMKPFECVGEVDELRYAYHLAQAKGGYATLPFLVPESQFDIDAAYPAQDFSDTP